MSNQSKQNQAALLYAIIAEGTQLNTVNTGLFGMKLEIVTGGGLNAIVSWHEASALTEVLGKENEDQIKDLVIDYHTLLNELSAHVDLLPVRFGTAFPDGDAIARHLETNLDDLKSQISRVRGHQEWTILLSENTRDEAPSAADPKDYLRARQLAKKAKLEAEKGRVDLVNKLLVPHDLGVAEAWCDTVSKESAAQGVFATIKLLVQRSTDQAFLAKLSAIIEGEAGVDASVIGPEAPFAFARIESQNDAA
ncbi:MAG: GvpL/GvpF family gas vesicle protein [Pseudomonadota bacterium]